MIDGDLLEKLVIGQNARQLAGDIHKLLGELVTQIRSVEGLRPK